MPYAHDKPALDMTCSFTADTDGYVYDLPGRRDVPAPEELELEGGPGPWVAGWVGPTPAAADGTRESTHRMWFRIPHEVADDWESQADSAPPAPCRGQAAHNDDRDYTQDESDAKLDEMRAEPVRRRDDSRCRGRQFHG